MPKSRFDRVYHSVVSLMIVFVLVGVGFFIALPRLTFDIQAQVRGNVTVNSENGLDSGAECSTTQECIDITNDSRSQCVAGSCQITEKAIKSLKKNTLESFSNAVDQADNLNKPNAEAFSGDTVLPSVALGITEGLVGRVSASGSLLQAGLLQNLGNSIVYMYDQPAASSYIAAVDLLQNAGIPVVQPAYAQNLGGLGFASLNPILAAWKTFRNIAYLFFVIIILVIGFMIMARQKMGQSAVTAQQAIPRIIVALITVTFSYAIAGFLIDLMYILMALMVGVFGFAGDDSSKVLFSNPLEFFSLIAGTTTSSATAVQAAVEGLINGDAFKIATISGWSVGLVVGIAVVFAVLQLFWELLSTYIKIIISITLSPILLMLGAIPGRDVFGSWLKGLIGNLAAFPTVLLILLMYDQITGVLSGRGLTDATGGGFSPPYLFGTVEPGGLAYFFIGFGFLLSMTAMVKEAKKALGATGGVFDQFSTAFGDSLKKGWEGGQLIPGVGWTDTNRLPLGGFSGKNVARKTAVTGGALIGGLGGVARNLDAPLLGFRAGVATEGGRAASFFDDKNIYKKQRAAHEEAEKKKKAAAHP